MSEFNTSVNMLPGSAYELDIQPLLGPFSTSPLAFKIACVLLSLFFISFIIYFLIKTKWFKLIFLYNFIEFINLEPYGYKTARRRWNKIIKNMKKFQKKYYNKSVINADKILDRLLKNLVTSYQAKNFEERLRAVGLKTFSHPKNIWEAHLYCENYLLTNNYILNKKETDDMLKIYEQALRDIEII